jgi:glycosyltransferase involved in cell wall biosynthesis
MAVPSQEASESAAQRLSVLVLDEWVPYPPDTGKRVRTWNLLRRLAQRHRISLLCYGEPEGGVAGAVRSAGIQLHTVTPLAGQDAWRLYPRLAANLFSPYPFSVTKHYTRRFRRHLKDLLREELFDLVHCEWAPYARFLSSVGRISSIVMAHNIESQIWSRRARQSRTLAERAFFFLQARKMESFERHALSRAGRVAAVTPLDAEQLAAWGVRHISLVENGVDLDQFVPGEEAPQPGHILFCGSLDWYPNLDALDYLLEKIMPPLIQRLPGVKLRIVGKGPPSGLQKRLAGRASVEFVGEVPDVRPHLAQTTVVVVPLRIGGGSRIKILEALAMEKAVVSTSIGAEGLAVADGVHLLLADTPTEFASRTIELLTSPQESQRLGENGRRLVVDRYSWDRAAEALESAWLQVSKGCQQSTVNGQEEQAKPLFTVN